MNGRNIIIPTLTVGLCATIFFALQNGLFSYSRTTERRATEEQKVFDFADVTPTVPKTQPAVDRDGWRTYESAAYRFRVSFPGDYEAREYPEADDAMSLTVSKAATGEGFQVYVTPYAEDQITEKRFRLDVSSGVMREPVDVMISGVRGTMFWSRNSIMGETREVWFINNGFLYEVVTYKQLDEWLSGIMQTWEFL